MRVWICATTLLILLNVSPVNAIDISGCTVISSPGYYNLVNDILNSSESACISIDSDDVVFDGGGHLLDGIGIGTGIRVTGSNVLVKNVTVKDWYYGIHLLSQSGYTTISNLSILNNYYGLLSYYGKTNVSKVIFENNTIGVKLRKDYNVFRHNTVKNNKEDGLIVESSSNSEIKFNNFENNGRYGILLFLSSNISIENNSFVNDGLYIDGGSYNPNYYHKISNNTVNGKELCYFKDSVVTASDCGSVIAVNSDIDINLDIKNTDVGLLAVNSSVNLSNSSIENCIYGVFLKQESVLDSLNLMIKNCEKGIYTQSESRININKIFLKGGTVYLSGDDNNLKDVRITDGHSLKIWSDNNELQNVSLLNMSGSPSLHLQGSYNFLKNVSVQNSYSTTLSGDNNAVTAMVLRNNSYGLEISGRNITVSDSIFRLNNHRGISIMSARNASLKNCTITDHLVGVSIIHSDDIELSSFNIIVGRYYGMYIRESSNVKLENTSISYFTSGIRLFKAENLTILNCSISNNEHGLYLERTNASLISSVISRNNIGIYSLYSNLTAINNKVCSNNRDFNSSDWMQSYGENNSCDIPDGWNDTGVIGCKYPCFDCGRYDATYIRLTGELKSLYIHNKTFKIDRYSNISNEFGNGSLNISNIKILRTETGNGFLSSEFELTYFNKSYRGSLEGIVKQRNLFLGIVKGDINGKFYGNLNGTNFKLNLIVFRVNNSPAYYKFYFNDTTSLNESESINGTISVKNFEYTGRACGGIQLNVGHVESMRFNLSEIRIEIKLNNSKDFTIEGFGDGKYYIGNETYNYFWIISNDGLYGSFDGVISGLLIGKLTRHNNVQLVDGIVYKEYSDTNRSLLPSLSVEIRGPKTASPGGIFEYYIKAANIGFTRATNVRIDLMLGRFLSKVGQRIEGIEVDRIEESNSPQGDLLRIKYLDPGEEVKIYVIVEVDYINSNQIHSDKIFIRSKAAIDCSEMMQYEMITGEHIDLPEELYVPPLPVWSDVINISESLFENDGEFQGLKFWLENQGFRLLPMIQRIYYDTGNTSDIAVFARDDGEFVLCFKADNGYPVLVNYTDNRIRYFNETGGFIYDLMNGTLEYYGTWRPHSPTFGDCLGNCLESKYGVLQIYSYYNWAKTALKLAKQSGKGLLNEVAGAILTPWNLIKHGKVCYTCLSSNWSTETATVLSNCHDCFMATNLLSGLFGPYYDISACALDCKMDTWSHSCQEGRYMARCSKYSALAYLSTGITADLYPDKRIIYQCVDGKWKHIRDESCGNGESCMDIPGSGRVGHDAWCVTNIGKSGFTFPPPMSFWTTAIYLAHDPNAKYVNESVAKPGDWINYTIEFENTGNGTAYGVYVEDSLSEYLNDSSLIVGAMCDYNGSIISNGSYDPTTRTIRWDVGEVPPKSGGKANIMVRAVGSIERQVDILNYATVYFPSVFEITTTNTTVTHVCAGDRPYIYNNTCVNCTSDADCGANEFCNESHWCERIDNPPIARMHVQSTAFVNQNVTFDATKSYDPDGDKITCYWNFEDGNLTVGEVVKHAYSSPGIYNVTLGVVDEKGEKDFTSATITVVQQNKPVASFTYSPSIPWEMEPVIFNASSSHDSDGSIVNYSWNFGDGNITTTTEPDIVHAYTKVGNYAVNLTVTDNNNLTNSTTKLIRVTVKGDFNGNFEVDIGDVTYVAWMLIGKADTNLRADFNNNGRVDIGDLAKIAYYLLGKISEL